MCSHLHGEVLILWHQKLFNISVHDRNWGWEMKTQACVSGSPDLLWFASCFRKKKEEILSDDFPEYLMDKTMENRKITTCIQQENYTDSHGFIFPVLPPMSFVCTMDQSRKTIKEVRVGESFTKDISVSVMKSQEKVKRN